MKTRRRCSLLQPVKPAFAIALCVLCISAILAVDLATTVFGQTQIKPRAEESPLPPHPIPLDLIRAGLSKTTPVNPATGPEIGTFYMLGDYLKWPDGGPPYPINPWTNCPVYPFGPGNVFLVDNAPPNISDASAKSLDFDPPLPTDGGDEPRPNCLSWPVSLTNLVLVDPANAPEVATYYLYLDQANGDWPVPYPMNICSNCDVYYLCESNQFLVDDRFFTHPEPAYNNPVYEPKSYSVDALIIEIMGVSGGVAQLRVTNTAAWQDYTIQSAPTPIGPWTPEKVITGTDAQNWIETSIPIPIRKQRTLFFRAHLGADILPLWLEAVNVSGGWMSVDLYRTSSNDTYELFSTESLSSGNWQSEGVVEGADGLTSVIIPTANRQTLFIKAADVSLDTDGQGLPDWWQIELFGSTGIDPWGNPDGDAFSNIEEYYNGTSPTSFDTPPAPIPFAAFLDAGGTTATLTWRAASGPVSHYEIKRSDYNPATHDFTAFQTIAQPTAAETSFQDTGAFTAGNPSGGSSAPQFLYARNSTYEIEAVYVSGNSLPAYAQLENGDPAFTVDARLIRNSDGRWQITCPTFPNRIQKLRLSWFAWQTGTYTFQSSQDISTTDFVSGIYVIPDSEIVQHTNSAVLWVRGVGSNEEVGNSVNAGIVFDDAPFFVDGRQHAMENLRFLLRAATLTRPFGINDTWHTNHAESGFLTYEQNILAPDYFPFVSLNDLKPLSINYYLRGALLATNEVPDSSGWKTNFLTVPGLAVLGTPDPYWIWQNNVSDLGDLALSAVGTWPNQMLHLASGVHNLFGLDIRTGLVNFGVIDPVVGLPLPGYEIPPGTSRSVSFNGADVLNYFSQFAQPSLSTVGYYFAPVISPGPVRVAWDTRPQRYPLPPLPEFAATNQSPLMIASVGEPILIGGWAKMEILNGTPNKFAYLGQYFEGAYKMNTAGVMTTNRTGILSPYGEFFPIEPGQTALVTMTNWGENVHGNAIVHVISLNVDGNHDGTMDFSYFGPDQTTPNRPYRFWVNDDDDSGDTGGLDISADPKVKRHNNEDNHVNGVRDLVDFFPVCLNIQSVLKTYPQNTLTCWLRQQDGALNYVDTEFYQDAVLYPSNCLTYLTDTNIARFVGRDSPTPATTYQITSSGVILNSSFVSKIRNEGRGILLVEATKPTKQPLVLEIYDGTNLLASTSLYLSISPVEQMFRHKNLIRPTFNNSIGFPDRLVNADISNEPETNEKNFVFLHGYSVNPVQARGSFAETFKRMYWSGSRAKFYGISWKGYETQLPGGITPNYHINVGNAFATAPKLTAFLSALTNGPTTIVAHSLGNMVALVALNDWDAPMNNYFMLDAAVAVEAVDGGAAPDPHMTHSTWVAPENYANRLYATYWCNLFPSSDARSMLTWSSRLANFGSANVYNFYSSGEEVLREYYDDPPVSAFGNARMLQNYWANRPPVKSFVWVWQEKAKGVSFNNNVLGSTHGGWKFNAAYNTNGSRIPAAQANVLPGSQLRTNSFFDFDDGSHAYSDLALFSPSGSTYAQSSGNRILADAIPAMSWPVGSHAVPRLSLGGQPTRNFNIYSPDFQNGWPAKRLENLSEFDKWWHSDFKDVAYTFTYKLFDKFVELGDLK